MSSVEAAASTRRPSLSNFILEGLPDFLHFLTPDRRILYASPSCKSITGFEPPELHGRFIGAFIHPDDHDIFTSALDEALSFFTSNRLIYRFRKADGQWIALESVCHARINSDQSQNPSFQALNARQGLYIMARPYFSEYTTLFDSFLECRIEHERLSERIAELKHEEDDAQALEASECTENGDPATTSRAMCSSTHATLSRVPTTSQYESIEDSKCDSDGRGRRKDKFKDYSRGSLGIKISRQTESMVEAASAAMPNKRRKKGTRTPESHVCSGCGTVVSAEWRKGPDGPKTLCNACGLRWAKHMRKTTSENKAPSSTA